MMENLKIKGKYKYIVRFCNMFCNYEIKIMKNNLITNSGLDFFIDRMVEDEVKITKLGFGINNIIPTKEDTDLTDSVEVDVEVQKSNDGITLLAESTGGILNGKCEIGAIAENTTTKDNFLISRSVHDPLVLPDDATISIEYYFKINN